MNNPFVTQAGATGVNSSGNGVIVSGKGLVFANSDVGTSNVDPYGPVGGLPIPAHGGTTLSAAFTNAGAVATGTLLNGQVTSLELIATVSDPGQNAAGASGPIPFANIAVPVGTVFTVSGLIAPSAPAASASFSTVVGGGNIITSSVAIKLTGTGTVLGGNIGTVTVTGHNGSYNPKTASPTGILQTTANLTIAGFNPANDQQIIGLDVINATSLATLFTDLTAALQGTNPGATVFAPTGSAASILTGNGDNVEILLPTASTPNVTPESLSYDFSNYSANGTGVAVTQITVLPEPTVFGALALGGLGILGRRRRKVQA
jgi:hypothetical protein